MLDLLAISVFGVNKSLLSQTFGHSECFRFFSTNVGYDEVSRSPYLGFKNFCQITKYILVNKVKTEKPCNGKTIKNGRRNDCNWLILVLKDTWHYERDWENAHIYVKMLFSFWGDWKWKIRNHKNAKFSKLSNIEILMEEFFYFM